MAGLCAACGNRQCVSGKALSCFALLSCPFPEDRWHSIVPSVTRELRRPVNMGFLGSRLLRVLLIWNGDDLADFILRGSGARHIRTHQFGCEQRPPRHRQRSFHRRCCRYAEPHLRRRRPDPDLPWKRQCQPEAWESDACSFQCRGIVPLCLSVSRTPSHWLPSSPSHQWKPWYHAGCRSAPHHKESGQACNVFSRQAYPAARRTVQAEREEEKRC